MSLANVQYATNQKPYNRRFNNITTTESLFIVLGKKKKKKTRSKFRRILCDTAHLSSNINQHEANTMFAFLVTKAWQRASRRWSSLLAARLQFARILISQQNLINSVRPELIISHYHTTRPKALTVARPNKSASFLPLSSRLTI